MSNKENCEPESDQDTYKERIRHFYKCYYGSDDDTDDASETEMINDEEEYSEMKEQMYNEKLADFKNQLKQLENYSHPTYLEGAKDLEEKYKERQFQNKVFYEFEVKRIEDEHEMEKEAAFTEFNEKQKELKENLISDLEEKRRNYEVERDDMDIVCDTEDVVQPPIRKLRRRGNEGLSEPKKRKISPSILQINYQLTEEEIDEDLRSMNMKPAEEVDEASESMEESFEDYKNSDIRVENGKLYYEKYWYHRGQQIYYEIKDGRKNSAVIITINSTEVWVRRTIDSEKFQIFISELLKGTIILKRRCA